MFFNRENPPIPVAGFVKANRDTMVQIIEYFGLKSTPEMLEPIRLHYLNNELRDPLSDEMMLIDRLINTEPETPAGLMVTSVDASDRFVGEAYEDTLFKLSDLIKKRKPPYSFEELAFPAERFLAATEKANEGVSRIFAGENALLSAAASDGEDIILMTSETGKAAVAVGRSGLKRPEPISPQDTIVLIAPTDNAVTGKRFIPTLASMIFTYRHNLSLKAIRSARGGNLLYPLLSAVGGASLDLRPLPPAIGLVSPELLAYGFGDCAFAVLPDVGAHYLHNIAPAYNLAVFFIGRPNRVRRLCVECGRGIQSTFNVDFLFACEKRVCVPADAAAQPDAEADGTVFSYSTTSENGKFTSTAVTSGAVISAAHTGRASFRDGALAFTEAVSRTVARGVAPKYITASFDAGISGVSSKEETGDSLAMLMGLYRAQAEICTVSRGSGCRVVKEPYLDVFIAARAPAKVIPDKLTKSGSRIYLVTPALAEDGLPDYRDVRAIYSFVSDLAAAGKILSAAAVGREGIGVTLERYIPEGLTLDAKNVPVSPVGSFILETDAQISGFLLGISKETAIS